MEISCNVVRDLLPLYAEDMVSEDSRELVRDHIARCPACRENLTAMCVPVEIPKDNVDALRNTVENIIKSVIVWVMAAVLVLITIVGVVFSVLVHPYAGPMEEVLVSVTEQDGQVAEEYTLAGAIGADFYYRKDPATGQKVKFIGNYNSLYSILFGTVPTSDETYINDYSSDHYQAVWFYDDGELIHLWGDETKPDLRAEEGSPLLFWTVGLCAVFGLLAWVLRSKKFGTVSLFMCNAAIADLITTGGNWFPSVRLQGDYLFITVWIVLLAFLLTFSIKVCRYLLRNRRTLF